MYTQILFCWFNSSSVFVQGLKYQVNGVSECPPCVVSFLVGFFSYRLDGEELVAVYPWVIHQRKVPDYVLNKLFGVLIKLDEVPPKVDVIKRTLHAIVGDRVDVPYYVPEVLSSLAWNSIWYMVRHLLSVPDPSIFDLADTAVKRIIGLA